MKLISTYLGIVMLSFSVFTIAENGYATSLTDGNEWKLRKDKNDIKVYTRTHTDTGIVECKIETTVKTEISKLVKTINNVENYPAWMNKCESASVFNKINDSLRIDYIITAVPWPMKDRDIVLEYRTVSNNNEHYEATINAITELIPEKENIVRVKEAKGSWVFNKIDTYQHDTIDKDDLVTEKTKSHYTLQDWEQTYMNKENEQAIFISALKKDNLESFKKIVYNAVKEIHITRFPYNDFLYQEYDA